MGVRRLGRSAWREGSRLSTSNTGCVTEDNYRLALFLVESVVAVGTVGALIAALLAFRYERVERRRLEVKGVRSWVRWIDPDTEEDRDHLAPDVTWPKEGYVPELCVENQSDEFIYDVDMTLWPTKLGLPQFSAYREQVGPGQAVVSRLGMRYEGLHTMLKVDSGGLGNETMFRDARGDRWARSRNGQLLRLRPIRWYAPWRVLHETDMTDVPFWAFRTQWRYRWRDHRERDHARLPPEWWAVDLRWKRWRYAREHVPIGIPIWSLRKRWHARKEFAAIRVRAGLPIPMWTMDEWWRHRRHLAEWRRAERKQARAQRDWERKGRPGL